MVTQLNEVAGQKDLDEKEIKQREKQKNNKKVKNLVMAKETGKVDKYGLDMDDYDDDYYSDEEDV